MRVIASGVQGSWSEESALLTCCLNKMYVQIIPWCLMSMNIEITFALEHDKRLILSVFNFALAAQILNNKKSERQVWPTRIKFCVSILAWGFFPWKASSYSKSRYLRVCTHIVITNARSIPFVAIPQWAEIWSRLSLGVFCAFYGAGKTAIYFV